MWLDPTYFRIKFSVQEDIFTLEIAVSDITIVAVPNGWQELMEHSAGNDVWQSTGWLGNINTAAIA